MINDDKKPVMSQQEASWHEHIAGLRAAEVARNQGEDPALIEAVVDATLPRPEVAGFQIKPATKGTLMAISRLAKQLLAYAKANDLSPSPNRNQPGELEMLEMAFMIMVFSEPKMIYRDTKDSLPAYLIAEAERLIFDVPALEMLKIQEQLEVELAAIGMVSPEEEPPAPGKPGESDQSSVDPTPQPEAPSPSSTGSCQNTKSPSPTPFGNSPSSPPMPSYPPGTNGTVEIPAPHTLKTQTSPPGTAAAAGLVSPTRSSPAPTHGGYPEH